MKFAVSGDREQKSDGIACCLVCLCDFLKLAAFVALNAVVGDRNKMLAGGLFHVVGEDVISIFRDGIRDFHRFAYPRVAGSHRVRNKRKLTGNFSAGDRVF